MTSVELESMFSRGVTSCGEVNIQLFLRNEASLKQTIPTFADLN